MRADRDAGRVQLAQTPGAHQSWDRAARILGEPLGTASKPTADGIDGRRKAMPLQHRPGVVGEVVIGVVEGQDHRACRQLALTAQAGQGVVETQHPIAETREQIHLGGEAPMVAIVGAMFTHRRKNTDLVIHQNRNARFWYGRFSHAVIFRHYGREPRMTASPMPCRFQISPSSTVLVSFRHACKRSESFRSARHRRSLRRCRFSRRRPPSARTGLRGRGAVHEELGGGRPRRLLRRR
jgi:hypothetical protein